MSVASIIVTFNLPFGWELNDPEFKVWPVSSVVMIFGFCDCDCDCNCDCAVADADVDVGAGGAKDDVEADADVSFCRLPSL